MRKYKHLILEQSETNFNLQQELQTIDQRIGLLLCHRLVVEKNYDKAVTDKVQSFASRLQEGRPINEEKKELYGHMILLLQNSPHYLARLARQLPLSEIDDFLQIVMFTVFGSGDARGEFQLLSVFECALNMEFTACPELGNLMRSNTATSRMMTSYSRREQGQVYLRKTLRPPLRILFEMSHINLDTDPVKIYRELGLKLIEDEKEISSENCAIFPEVQRVIEERVQCLMEMTSRFLSAITQSLDDVPYGVRWLCRTIKMLTRQKYRGATIENISSLIGGFFLLRFVNPAIISPDAFNIMEDKPSGNVRRNLTFIAKTLQSAANSAEYAKHKHLASLHNFVQLGNQQLHAFFAELCDVEDFFDQYRLQSIEAIADLEKTLVITPNDLFTLHRLMDKYRKSMGLAADDKMILLLDELGPPPQNLARQINTPLSLLLISRWDASTLQDIVVDANVDSSLQGGLASQRRHRVQTGADVELEQAKLVYESICSNHEALTRRLTTYHKYLQNVRGQAISINTLKTGHSSIQSSPAVTSAKRTLRLRKAPAFIDTSSQVKAIGPFAFKISKLDKAGVVVGSSENLPPLEDPARMNIVLTFSMPTPGVVNFSVRQKGRPPLFHIECTLDDLLDKVDSEEALKLGDVISLDAHKTLILLDRTIFRR
eukprot:m.151912 g.151912  ORF g.151912 m.151912 type:complete len:659 (-) comp20710_c0_seq3:186-2162(-)